MIGQTFSKYRITDKIGEGGMGEVYRATDTVLEREVALKFLPEEMTQDDTARRRFLREAQSAAALDHPYICNIHDTGEIDGKDFIAMEYVAGQTLRDKLAAGTPPVEECLQIASEIAEALEEAHQNRIVHRDLKPSNIMLRPDGHVKVMDFGLAKRVQAKEEGGQEATLTALTGEGTAIGTVPYMSPEQLKGEEVDTRSDIFSLGIILYEMLAGAHPFRKTEPVETVSAILTAQPPPLAPHLQEFSNLFQHVLGKMLAKDPANRYQLVHEVRTDLRALSPAAANGERGTPTPEKEPPSKTPPRRRRILILTALGLAAVVFSFLFWLRPTESPQAPPVNEPAKAKEGTGPFETRVSPLATLQKSIAILPFENLSESKEDAYRSDGIHNELITALSRIRDIKTIGRNSVMAYRGTTKPSGTIGEELRVATLLTGTVQWAGDRIRINVQLIDAAADANLWAEKYTRVLTANNIFEIQSEISTAIARELKAVLSPRPASVWPDPIWPGPLADASIPS